MALQYAPAPSVSLPTTLAPLLGEPLLLRPDTVGLSGATWTWQPPDFLSCSSCMSPLANPTEAIRYTLLAESRWGCRDSASVYISPNDNLNWYAPNAFSPNDDGVNDRFSLHLGSAAERVLVWEVYDRWGGLRWQAQNLPAATTLLGWNGQQNNEPAPTGLYTWRASVVLINGKTVTLAGGVLLLR